MKTLSQASTTRALPLTFALLVAVCEPSWAESPTPEVQRPAPPASQPLAKGNFLVASRDLLDPNFHEAVILLAETGPNGASGVVVNRPTNTTLAELLPDEEWLRPRNDTIYVGGPVAQDRLLLLIRAAKQPEDSQLVFDNVYISGSASTLRELATRDAGGSDFRPYMGYAGWAPGQLENEVRRGDWIIVPADPKAIFELPPGSLWRQLTERSAGEWATLRETLRIGSFFPS